MNAPLAGAAANGVIRLAHFDFQFISRSQLKKESGRGKFLLPTTELSFPTGPQ